MDAREGNQLESKSDWKLELQSTCERHVAGIGGMGVMATEKEALKTQMFEPKASGVEVAA